MEERFSASPEELEQACLRENYCSITYAEHENLGATYQLILEAYKDNHPSAEEHDSILSFRPTSARRSERYVPDDYLYSPFGAQKLQDSESEFARPVLAKRDEIEERVNNIHLENSIFPRKVGKSLDSSRLPFDDLSHHSINEPSINLTQFTPKTLEAKVDTASTKLASTVGVNSKKQSNKESMSVILAEPPQTKILKLITIPPLICSKKVEKLLYRIRKACPACPKLVKTVESVYVLLQKIKPAVTPELKKSPAKSTKTVSSQNQGVGTSTPELRISQATGPLVLLPILSSRRTDPLTISCKMEKTSKFWIQKRIEPESRMRMIHIDRFEWLKESAGRDDLSAETARHYPSRDATVGQNQKLGIVVVGNKPVKQNTQPNSQQQVRSRPLLTGSRRATGETSSRRSSGGLNNKSNNQDRSLSKGNPISGESKSNSEVGFQLKDVIKDKPKSPEHIPVREDSIKITSDLSEKNSISRISRHSYLQDAKEEEVIAKSKDAEFNLALLTQNESMIERKSHQDSSLVKRSTDDESKEKILEPRLRSPDSKSASLASQIIPEVQLKPMLEYPDEKELLKAQEKSRNIKDSMKVSLVSSNKHTKPIAPLGKTSIPEVPQFARHLRLEIKSSPAQPSMIQMEPSQPGYLGYNRAQEGVKIIENKDDSDNVSQKTKLFRIRETQANPGQVPNGMVSKKAPGPMNSFAVNAAFAPLTPELFMYQSFDQQSAPTPPAKHQRRDSSSGVSETSDKTKKAVKMSSRAAPVTEVSEKNQALNHEMRKVEALILQYAEASKWSPDRERLRLLVSDSLKQKSTVFSAYSLEFVDFIIKHGQFTFAPKDSVIFNHGDKCSQMGIVIYGVIQHKCKNGLATLTHGGFLCEEAMLRPEPVLMEATEVLSKSCLLWLPGNSLQELRDFCERGKKKNEYILFVAQLKKQLGMKS